MEPIFKQNYEISAIHVDCYGRLKPSTILYFSQEAAGGHCDLLRLDWDTMAKQHLFWAVIRHRVQITRLPMLGEKITVETWPMPTTRTAYPRSIVALDENGQELFRAISLWVLMDTQTRAMVLPGKSGVDVAGVLRGNELAPPGSIHPMVMENTTSRKVGYTDLDRNGHMNNTRYMDWVEDLLPSAFHQEKPVREFTVCYLSEATEGQSLKLDYQLLDGPVLQVDAHRQRTDVHGKTERVFSAQVLF